MTPGRAEFGHVASDGRSCAGLKAGGLICRIPSVTISRRSWPTWFSYRVAAILTVIALVPLVGAGWFAVGAVLDARSERLRADQVDLAVEEVVELSELRARLLDEQNWMAAQAGIAELGLPVAAVAELTGIDIPDRATEAAAAVDRLMLEVEAEPELVDELARLRGEGDGQQTLDEAGYRYTLLEAAVAELAEARLDEAIDGAADVTDGGSLIATLRVFSEATKARQAVSAEFNHYFGAQFSAATSRTDEIRGILSSRSARLDSLAEIERLAAADSATAQAMANIAASTDATGFHEASDEVADANIGGDAPEAALSAVLDDLGAVSRDFEHASATTELYFDLVEAAGADVDAAAADARAAAQARDRQATLVLAFLVVLSGVAAAAATRAIVRPLHRLADSARRLSTDQDGLHYVPEQGPHEIRDAARALNQATDSLALAERQALALAEGDLDHESLLASNGGALGASLQAAVRTLATSVQEREDYRRRMTYEANHDGLTHLPNRNASLEHLERGLAGADSVDGGRLAILFIDLDGFKDINDRLGHQVGDEVLRVTAERLASTVRTTDHAGRIGGDEFVVIAQPVVDATEAVKLATRLREALTQPIDAEESMVAVGASIGIALTSDEVSEASDLLRRADLALYQAKDTGRDRIEVCTPQLEAAISERMSLEQALGVAIDRDEFELHYQSIVNASSGDLIGYEALIRWNRPGHGMVAPDDFIPVAERSNLIVDIDRWVIEHAAAQMAAWTDGGKLSGLAVSINVSGRHLAATDFVNHVLGPVQRHGVDPSTLVIEVTESALLDEPVIAASKLQTLRDRGVRIAIDDFGTGYTSLTHLRSLPIDILKIDQSFTRDETAGSLVQLIIDTGHLLGASITAEGIETADQASWLVRMGSDGLQGYLFGRPTPPDALAHDRSPRSSRATTPSDLD